MNTILVLIKLAKMFATLHVVGKYLQYSIVSTQRSLKSHLFKAVQYFDAIDLNAEILYNSKLL